MGEETISAKQKAHVLEHGIPIGFNLNVYAAVSEWVIYQSLGMMVVIVLGIAVALTIILASLGRMMAIYYAEPLEMIAEKIKLVGEGNFNTKLDESLLMLLNI